MESRSIQTSATMVRCNYNTYTKLTYREKQCIHWLVRGKSAKEIAVSLCISHRTVEEYLDSIKAKFCLSKRTALCYEIGKLFQKYNIELISN